jgi:molybdopterin molybdotransferase
MMINYKEARELLINHARSFGTESVSLDAAQGRVLSEKIMADRDYPPFNRSAMDGYALSYNDWKIGIRRFEVVETIFAGAAHLQSIHSGQCYKIMTGAAVPDDADLVIRREDTEEGEGTMVILTEMGEKSATKSLADSRSPLKPFLNIARQGEDLRSADIVIERPCLCEPAVIGLLASLGKKEVRVAKLPKVALLTTGNEIVGIDEPVNAGQIRNSNRWLLQAALQKWGIDLTYYQHVPDDRETLHIALEKALNSDMIILCGGVSAGDADYVPEALEASGVKKIFHKMAIKPGKPAWCGIAPEGGMVFALPGNPISCLVGFALLIQPWLHASFGLAVPLPLGLPLLAVRKKKTPLDEFFPVRLAGNPAGVSMMAMNGSGDIRLGLEANALALHEAERGDLDKGDTVLCYPLW